MLGHQSKDMKQKQIQIDQQSQPFVASYHSLHKCCQPLASLKRIKRLNFLTSSIVLQGTGLLEKLLTMLDPLSIKRLTQSELVDKNVLKDSLSSKTWAGLIKRSSYWGEDAVELDDVKNLVAIVKFLALEDPSSFLLPLLHHICYIFPAEEQAALLHPREEEAVILKCLDHDPHKVTLWGFLLLEEVESSFRTTIQSVERITYCIADESLDEPFLSALRSRVMRQESPAASIKTYGIALGGGLKSAQAFSILMKASQVDVSELVVYEAIGEEGWKILAKAMPTGTLPDIIVTWDAL